MDMLVLFMLFCTIPPFILWSRRRAWALIQLPLIAGMWAYPFIHNAGDIPASVQMLAAVLFYGNLIFTEAALIRWCIDFGKGLKLRSRSFE